MHAEKVRAACGRMAQTNGSASSIRASAARSGRSRSAKTLRAMRSGRRNEKGVRAIGAEGRVQYRTKGALPGGGARVETGATATGLAKIGLVILLLIGLGGAVGSIARYLVGGAVQRSSQGDFPFGTLAVNVLGCIVAGALVRVFATQPEQQALRAALIVGFCGGFTTFSAFSVETVGLVQRGEWIKAAVYVVLSVVAGLAGTALALGSSRSS
jgi:CrcB protein